MKILHQYPYTSVSVALAFLVLGAASFFAINVFDLSGVSIIGIERSEVGQVSIAFLLIIPAFFTDRVLSRQNAHEARMQAEQLRVLRVTMRTVQDLVNNRLNQLQILRLEAEGYVSAETLAEFDSTVRDIAAQLTILGDMQVFAEDGHGDWTFLHVGASAPPSLPA